MSLNFLLYFERTEWRVIEIMECKVIPFHTVEERSKTDADKAEALLSQAMEGFHKKLVVLDDDPTGVQTVHDVSVYTDWEEESIRKGFEEKESMVFYPHQFPQLFCGRDHKGTPGYCRTCCKGGRGTGTGFHDHFPWKIPL